MNLNSKNVLRLFLGWLVALGLSVGVALWARNATIATYGTSDASTEWQTWRAEAELQNNSPGPVKRHVPSSAEPPALVLMRDYFVTIIVTSLVCGTLIYLFLVALLVVYLQGKKPQEKSPSPVSHE